VFYNKFLHLLRYVKECIPSEVAEGRQARKLGHGACAKERFFPVRLQGAYFEVLVMIK
jgi:hypothetical protein